MAQYFKAYFVEDTLICVQLLAYTFPDYFGKVFDANFHHLSLSLVFYIHCLFVYPKNNKK